MGQLLVAFRRFKYLEKMHEEEMNKILVYLKGFTSDERQRLAQITALWIGNGQLPATVLPVLINVSGGFLGGGGGKGGISIKCGGLGGHRSFCGESKQG